MAEGQGNGAEYKKLGAWFQAIPDAAYPWPADLVARIRHEIDPMFVPVWVNQLWETPAGTLVRTGHHMLCRHVVNPHHKAAVLHALLPTSESTPYPLIACHTLDGLTNDQRASGKFLPMYQPFGEWVLDHLKFSMWLHRNRQEVSAADLYEAEKKARRAKQRAVDAQLLARKRDRHYQFKWAMDAGQTVFLSEAHAKAQKAEEGRAAA